MKKTIIVLCTLLGLFACNSSKKGAEKQMKGENKLTKSYTVIQIESQTEFKKNATIVFNDDFTQISGNSGCNSYGGAITIKDTNFSMDPFLRVTKMYCQDNMADEKLFFRTLKMVKTYKTTKDGLSLLNKNGDVVMIAKAN